MNERTAEQNLASIRRMMEDTGGRVPGTGRHFIIWGLVTAVAALLTYAALAGAPLPVWPVWAISLAIGWTCSMWVARREYARAPVETLLARVVAGIWVGCGVSLSLLIGLGFVSGAVHPRALPGLVSIVLGGGYFASSFAYRIGWMRLLAVAWWSGGTVMLLRPGPWSLLLTAGLLVALQVIPGIVFSRREHARVPARGA